jgi:hypothetical protein
MRIHADLDRNRQHCCNFNFAADPDPAFNFDANPALSLMRIPIRNTIAYSILTSGANSIDNGKNVAFCHYFCSIVVTPLVILYGEEI